MQYYLKELNQDKHTPRSQNNKLGLLTYIWILSKILIEMRQ